MTGELEKTTPAPVPVAQETPKTKNLPVNPKQKQVAVPPLSVAVPPSLPAASVVYGVAASGLFVIALYFLVTGRWFTGALVLLPATCFLGFALHFLKAR